MPPVSETALLAAGRLDTPLARLVLNRARQRCLEPTERVDFMARCPGCGLDAVWRQQREDTRVRTSIDCSCP